jgi:membrane protein required for colicin V production
MNGADWVIIAILALSVIVGLWRGLVREAISLLVWIAAVAAAIAFGEQVSGWIGERVALPSVRMALGYGSVFVVVLAVGALVGWLVGRIVRGAGIGGTDRLMGLGFGLLRGGVIVAALILVLGYTPFARDPWWQQSQLIPRFEPVAAWLRERLPQAPAVLSSLQSLTPAPSETGAAPPPASPQ